MSVLVHRLRLGDPIWETGALGLAILRVGDCLHRGRDCVCHRHACERDWTADDYTVQCPAVRPTGVRVRVRNSDPSGILE